MISWRDQRLCWCYALIAFGVVLRCGLLNGALFVDEGFTLSGTAHYITQRTIIPPWFLHPPLFSYLSVITTGLTALIGGWNSGLSPSEWGLLQGAFADWHLALGNRILSLLFFAATALVLARELVLRLGGCAAVAGLAVYTFSPVCVQYSAYGLPEAGLGLFATLALFSAERYRLAPSWRAMLLAGIFTGIAASFKFHAVALAAACIGAVLAAGGDKVSRAKHLVIAGLASALAFLIFTPTFLLVPKLAFGGLHDQQGLIVDAVILGPHYSAFLGVGKFLFLNEVGLLISIVAGLLLLPRTRWSVVVPLAVILANFILVGGWQRKDPNYWFPSLPAASFLLAVSVHTLRENGRRVAAIASVLGFATVCVVAIGGASLFRGDNRDAMTAWLVGRLPADAIVVRDGLYTPKVWDPPVVERFLGESGRRWQSAERSPFAERLAHSPQAGRVIARVPGDDYYPADAGGRPVWVLTSSLPVSRTLDFPAPPGGDALHQHETIFYNELFLEGGPWKLERVEKSGQGQTQYAFSRRD